MDWIRFTAVAALSMFALVLCTALSIAMIAGMPVPNEMWQTLAAVSGYLAGTIGRNGNGYPATPPAG